MTASARNSALLALAKIRPGEEQKALAMFFYLFFSVGSFIVGRISRDTLFLTLPNAREVLPYMYIGIAIGVSAATTLYSRLSRRLLGQRLAGYALVFFAGTVAVMRVLLAQSTLWYWVYYVWVDVFGALMVIQCWSVANDIFDARQAKRLFAFVGGGGVVSNIACGFGVKQLAEWTGAMNLVPVVALMIVAAWLCERWVSRAAAKELAEVENKQVKRVAGSAVIPALSSKHLQIVAALVALTFFVSTVVDYQFKIVAANAFPDAAQRAAYFGNFFGVTGLISATVQFLLTGFLLERFGVLVSLLLLPLAMLSGTGAMLMMPGLLAATWVKGSENVLRYTVNDATMQLLYVPVPAAQRGRAKAFIDGVLKPSAIGLSGVILLALSRRLPVQDLSYFVGVALVLWAMLVFTMKREYVRTLMLTLRRRRLDFAGTTLQITDESTIEALCKSLETGSEGHILHALELLVHVETKSKTMKARVIQLATNASMNVRLAALKYLGQHGEFEDVDVVAAHLTDPAEEVRAHAILAMAKLSRDHSVRTLQNFLKDPSPRAKAACVAGLIKYGGLDGILRSAEELKAMLTSPDSVLREQAAWVLGEIEVKNFYQPVLELFQDTEPRVRLAAINAAGKMKSPELTPALVYMLDNPRAAPAAINALTAYGPEIEPLLSKVLDNEHEDLLVRRQIPKILAAMRSPSALPLLMRFVGDLDLKLRFQAIRAAGRLHDEFPDLPIAMELVTAAVNEELERFYRWTVMLADLELGTADVLLVDALGTRREQALHRTFRLLGLRFPFKTLEMIYNALIAKQITPQARANAVEVLDNILDGHSKRALLPVVEGVEAQQFRIALEEYAIRRQTREECLQALLGSNDDWLTTVALERVGREKRVAHKAAVQALLEAPAPLVRETALWALHHLVAREEFERSTLAVSTHAQLGKLREALLLA